MPQDKTDLKVIRAIRSHQDWLSKWSKEIRFFSVDYVSPRGKAFTFSGYSHEVSKREAALVKKIRGLFDQEKK